MQAHDVPLIPRSGPARAGLILATLLVLTSAGGSPAPAAAPRPASEEVADAVENVLRATVALEGDGIYGAGVLIDPPRGLVLTSLHVVGDMKSPRVTSYDGRKGRGTIVSRDAKLDLAILSVPALKTPGLPPPRLADVTALRPGEEVYAVGSPRKLAFTVSRGIVSYVNRELEGARYLQVDMAINDGNSGGPVFNRRGEIVGVMSFILRRAQGLSFALPMTYARGAFPTAVPAVATRRPFRSWIRSAEAGARPAPAANAKSR